MKRKLRIQNQPAPSDYVVQETPLSVHLDPYDLTPCRVQGPQHTSVAAVVSVTKLEYICHVQPILNPVILLLDWLSTKA